MSEIFVTFGLVFLVLTFVILIIDATLTRMGK